MTRRRGAVLGSIAVVLLIAAAAQLFALRPLALAMPAPGLDGSWATVLGEAAEIPWRWGVDVAFTYGPASALLTRYFTPHYLAVALPVSLAVALLYGLCYERLLALSGRSAGPVATGVLAVVLATAAGRLDLDPLYFVLAFLVFLVDLRRPAGDRASLAVSVGGAALLGIVALAKTSIAIAALGLFILADIRSALLIRRLPLATLAFLAAAFASFLAFGQHVADLPPFLRLQWAMAAGYGEAMYLLGSRTEIIAYLASALGLLVAIGAPWRDVLAHGAPRPVVVLGTAFILTIGFKAGFVRQDIHTQIAWQLLAFVGLAAGIGVALPRSLPGAGSLMAGALILLWIVSPLLLMRQFGMPLDRASAIALGHDIRDDWIASLEAWHGVLSNPSGFVGAAITGKEAAWASIRQRQPLPPLIGTVDVVPSEQSAVLASRLDYRPRPSFQEYSTYTDVLIAANKAFYEGPKAPQWTMLDLRALDGRYPNSNEGALWPDLLTRYEPGRRAAGLLVLRRRAEPLPDPLGPVSRLHATLGQPFTVPAGPIFARITLRKTFLGRIAAALYRPPPLRMVLTMASGATASYRFIPALGAGGFLLSPAIVDPDEFARLGLGRAGDLASASVVSAEIAGPRHADRFYAPDIVVELQPLVVPPAQPSPGAAAYAAELDHPASWPIRARRLAPTADIRSDRLAAPAPTALKVPIQGATRLRLGFGIEDGAWAQGHTEGVCFSATPVKGGAPLWRRCLDPLDAPSDRGPQTAEIALPPDDDAVTLATACPKSCDWGWSYWGEITPDP